MTIAEKISTAVRAASSPQDRLAALTAELETERRKLADAQATVETLSVADDTSDAKLAAALAAVEAIRASIKLLDVRIAGVRRKVAEEAKARAVKERLGTIQRCEKLLAKRIEHAQRFVEHLTQAVAEYRELHALSNRAFMCFVGDASGVAQDAPAGVVLRVGELQREIEREIFRLGGREADAALAKGKPPSFPGSAAPLDSLDNPSALRPLVDVLAAANAYGSKVMRGEVPNPEPVAMRPWDAQRDDPSPIRPTPAPVAEPWAGEPVADPGREPTLDWHGQSTPPQSAQSASATPAPRSVGTIDHRRNR